MRQQEGGRQPALLCRSCRVVCMWMLQVHVVLQQLKHSSIKLSSSNPGAPSSSPAHKSSHTQKHKRIFKQSEAAAGRIGTHADCACCRISTHLFWMACSASRLMGISWLVPCQQQQQRQHI